MSFPTQATTGPGTPKQRDREGHRMAEGAVCMQNKRSEAKELTLAAAGPGGAMK